MGTQDRVARAVALECERQGVNARLLDRHDVEEFVSKLRLAFGAGRTSGALWECFRDFESWHEPDAWRVAAELAAGRPTVLLIDDWGGLTGLAIESVTSLQRVFAESEGFVFYLADPHGTFVLAMNDHDVLIGCGAAARWVADARQGATISEQGES